MGRSSEHDGTDHADPRSRRRVELVVAPLTISWPAPEPRNLPDLRDRLREDLRSSARQTCTEQALRDGAGSVAPRTGDYTRDARTLLTEEDQRLAAADLFYVSAEMTRLAVAAAETLPVHSLDPTDIPSPAGFCVFAEPIEVYPHRGAGPDIDMPIVIVAASWGDSAFCGLTRERGVWMTLWTWQDAEIAARWLHDRHGVSWSKARAQARAATPPLAWENEVAMAYGAAAIVTSSSAGIRSFKKLDHESAGRDVAGGTLHTGMIVRAAWLLMTQPGVTDVEALEPTRSERRRAHAVGRPAPDVRVVKIRHQADRPTARSDDEGAGSTYHVRWTVRGHWRRQWYPSRGDHRPVWINPHVKGPDDAPLRSGQTVHLLDSPRSTIDTASVRADSQDIGPTG